MKGDQLVEQVILHYLVHLKTRQYQFLHFCNDARVKGTNELFFGEKGSEKRRKAQFKLNNVREKLKSKKIHPSDNFKLEVRLYVELK